MSNLKKLLPSFFLLFSVTLFGQLSIATDQPDATYSVGESMNFLVTGGSGLASYTIHYDHGVTPAIRRGTIQLNGGTTSIPFRGTEPSVVICTVTNSGQTTVSGAAFSPFDIDPFEADPADFDAFWQNQKNQLAAVPISPRSTPISTWDNRTRSYRINLGHIDGRRVYGYLSIPLAPGKYPAIVTHAAFGVGPNLCVPRPEIAADIGAISLSIWMHDAEPDQQAQNAYFPKNWDNPAENYFRYGVLGIIRAIDYIYTLSEFDGQNVGLNGISEGGGMSILAAGIDTRVKAVSASIFAHGEHSGYKYGRASGFPYYLYESTITNPNISVENINQGAKYFDALRGAKRFKGPFLGSVGYNDLISVPATNFTVFNQFEGSKVLIHKIGWGHHNPDEFYLGKFEFFRKHFGLSGKKGYAANAGTDETVSNSASLSASIEKFGMEISSLPVEWNMVSGPGTVSFTSPNSKNTNVNFSANGQYILKITATDKSDLSASKTYYTISDFVKINVTGTNNNNNDQDQDGVLSDIDCDDNNPLISEEGDICDDLNPDTFNDIIQADCTCAGVAAPCSNEGGDADNDGICAFDDCNDFNPNISEEGDSCNDENPNTTNDIIQSDCTCEGTLLPSPNTDCTTTFSVNGNVLMVSPLNYPLNFVKVYDQNFVLLLSCEDWGTKCNATQTFTLPYAGKFFVQILSFSDWSNQVCDILEPIETQLNNACNNVENGGTIVGNETVCVGDRPNPITSSIFPNGGNGAMEYQWLSSTTNCPYNISDAIAGANQSTYTPPSISETTYYRRLSKRAGCSDWDIGISNCIVKYLDDCGGVSTNNCLVTYSINGNRIRFSNVDAPIATVKIVKDNWQEILTCESHNGAPCPESYNRQLTPGLYSLQILTANSWTQGFVCNINETFRVGNQFRHSNPQNDLAFNSSFSSDQFNDITVFPNPANDVINIHLLSQLDKSGKVDLVNQLGKVVKTLSFGIEETDLKISTDNLASGIYFLRIDRAKVPFTKRIFINKN